MSPRELANALYGLGLLLRFDGRAWQFFDKSPRGFWMSFTVAAVVAPFHFAHVALTYSAETGLGPVAYAIVEALSYVLTWTLFPFAMLYLSRLVGRETFYFWHMVPYNWFQLPVAVPLFAMALLSDLSLIPVEAFQAVNLLAMFVMAIFTTFIAAVGLRIPVGTAMSLMVLDFTLSFLASALIAKI